METVMQWNHLFEHLAVSPWILLAVHDDRNIPGPHVLNELAVLLLGRVKLDEVVALPVGSDIEGRKVLLATDHEGSADDGVVVRAVH